MTKAKQTFRKGYCEIDRELSLYGFCQDGQMAASNKGCQMVAFYSRHLPQFVNSKFVT